MEQLTWKVGGAQGEGIDSTGEILASTLNRLGHYMFAYRSFMSLIKGGHTNYKIRVADQVVRYHGDTLDILIAFDQLSISENEYELIDGSIVIHDAKFEPEFKTDKKLQILKVPMTETAKGLGNVIMKNVVALGVSAAVLNLPVERFYEYIEGRFGKKGGEIAEQNKTAIKTGYDFCRENYPNVNKQLPKPAPHPHYLVSGNEGASYGALIGGCRFEVAYPITPATEILYWAAAHYPKFGAKVMQAEDEIAACMMAIGANYAGVRSMTTTSGPGLSLMMEALGLAGISETPMVIIDVQRGGPSTGLPTRPEQSDLNTAVFGSHGEITRVVLAPSSIEECIEFGAEAFNLAERFQCPVIVLTDLFMGMNKVTVPDEDMNFLKEFQIDRGKLIDQAYLDKLTEEGKPFLRYELTADGISPRSIPGLKGGSYTLLSNEHSEESREEVEDQHNRLTQMDKRNRKLQGLKVNEIGFTYHGDENPDLLLIGFGFTRGQLDEVTAQLRAEGKKVGHAHIKYLTPFPGEAIDRLIKSAKNVLVVEQNSHGQLRNLIQLEIGHNDKLKSHLRYDGIPLTVGEIYSKCQEVL